MAEFMRTPAVQSARPAGSMTLDDPSRSFTRKRPHKIVQSKQEYQPPPRMNPTWRQRMEYLLARGILAIGEHCTNTGTLVAGAALGDLIRILTPDVVKAAHENLRAAYSDRKSDAEIEKLLQSVYHNVGITWLEGGQMLHMRREEILERVDVSTLAPVFDELDSGKPVVGVTMHYGNWELMGCAIGCCHPVAAVYRRLDNPLLDELLLRVRTLTGLEAIENYGGIRQMIRCIRSMKMSAFVIDQNITHLGVWAPFFGRMASTQPMPVQVALKWNLPIFVSALRRQDDGLQHRLIVRGPLYLEQTGDIVRDVGVGVARCNAVLEPIIRETPEQWFGWLHSRWLTPPPPGEPIFTANGERL